MGYNLVVYLLLQYPAFGFYLSIVIAEAFFDICIPPTKICRTYILWGLTKGFQNVASF